MYQNVRLSIAVFAGVLALPVSGPASEWERHPLLADRWRISLGSFFQSVDSDLSVSGSAGAITLPEFDFDEALKISSHDNRFSGYAHWRFGEKWSLALQYMEQKNGNTALVEDEITWEELTLRAGARASGEVSNQVYRVFFGRLFSTGPDHEFGAGLGVHWLEIGASLEGEFLLQGESQGTKRRSVSAGAPLPNAGIWYLHALSPRWAAHARIDYFSASFDEYSGALTNGGVGVVFQAFEHVALGLDYNYLELDVDVDSGSWLGSADFRRDGPFLHLTFTW